MGQPVIWYRYTYAQCRYTVFHNNVSTREIAYDSNSFDQRSLGRTIMWKAMKRKILYVKIKPINVILTKLRYREICPKKICLQKVDEI